ncbi:MAG: hypothetical protein P0Y55_06990 [Candidatus Cohnella colombiensis]|uniref:Uncharacterized protein n=1 Tax=Candidatus Cohnella colombiensis TaxID=3121368 RepID=A0AA95EZE1_9BACL|nr:MAG: hypothetical protein P0Y55_06990 [Cohnella sp.]
MNNRPLYPVMSLVVGLISLGLSITPTPLWFRIVVSVIGFAGIFIAIRGIRKMN